MSNERTGLYEGMFLFPQSATANLQGAIDHLKEIFEKVGATIINFKKWDDRRLAYEIEGNKRGVYFLVYFNAPTSILSDLERRCNQSEQLLRMMITRAEHLPSEVIEANDGAEDIATEIKLRGEKKTVKGASAGSRVNKKDDVTAKTPKPTPESKEPVTAKERAEPKPTPESAETETTPESAEPETTTERIEPETTPESAEPKATPESVEPKAVVAEEMTESEEVTEA